MSVISNENIRILGYVLGKDVHLMHRMGEASSEETLKQDDPSVQS